MTGPPGAGGECLHRVTPDGCADILFDGRGLQLVGAMTGWRDFPLTDGQRLFGVRFRPGMWGALVGAPAAAVTDRILPLDCLWGARAERLAGRMAEASSDDAAMEEAMAAVIPAPPPPGPLERALAWMERRRGIVSMDELAGHAGLSPRQLRRVALERTGLPPKFLARILRFRHAQQRLSAGQRASPPRSPPWRSIAGTTTRLTSSTSFANSPAARPPRMAVFSNRPRPAPS